MAVSAAGVVLAQGRAEVYVTVVNEDRRPVRGLGSEDFSLRDGGQRRTVLGAVPAADPLAVAIVVEGFETADVPAVRSAINEFVMQVGRGPDGSRFGVVGTAESPAGEVLMLAAGRPAADLETRLTLPRGSLVGGIVRGARALEDARTDRRVVLAIVRRRADEARVAAPYQATDALLRARASLWTIEVAGSGKPGALDEVLAPGSRLGGALRETAATLDDLTAAAARVADFLLSQYVITYTWPDPMISVVSVTTRHERGQVLHPSWPR
jgi:hypothetical protein